MDTTQQQQFSSPPKIAQRGRGTAQTRFEKETAANGGKVDTHGDPPNLGPWVLGDTIGKGSSGRVRLARHQQSGKLAAVKIIPKNIMFSSRMSISNAGAKHEKLMLSIRREIVIMKLIDHPNIMALYDVFEADNELFLLLEYIEGGELFDFLVSKGRLQPAEALRYFREIIQGVDYCHRFNICHRDLKPENLLLDKNKNIKIADFGMAAMEIANGMLETSCGSPHYASPEIVAGKAYHGAASDIWSCGVVLFALLVGRLPFDDPNMRLLLQKVRAGKFEMPAFIPADAKDLIWKMLVVDPAQRIPMSDIITHPFFTSSSVPRTLITPEPPSLEDIVRNIPPGDQIDETCMQNLVILWHGASERKIKEALLCPGVVNWEKAYYFLLVKYQQKTLEEFDENTYSFGFQSGRYTAPEYLIKHQLAKEQRDREEQLARRQVREREKERDRESRRRDRDSSMIRGGDANGGPRKTPATKAPFPTTPDRAGTSATMANMIVASREAPATPSPTKRASTVPGQASSRPRPPSLVTGPRPPLIQTKSAGPTFSTPRSKHLNDAASPSTDMDDRRRMPPPPSPQRRRSHYVEAFSNPLESPRSSTVATDGANGSSHSAASSTARAIESTSAEIVRARFGFGNPEREEAFSQSVPKTPILEGWQGPPHKNPTPAAAPSPRGLGLSMPGTTGDDGPTSASMSPQSSQRSSHSGAVRPVTIVAPTISPPLVQDPAIQKFFIEIAGALNSLNTVSPPLPPSTPTSANPTPYLPSPQHQRDTSTPGRDSRARQHHQHQSAGDGAGMMRSASNKENDGPTAGGSGVKTPVKAHTVDGFVNVTMVDATPVKPLFANGTPNGKKARPPPLELSGAGHRVSTFGLSPLPSPVPSPLLSGSDFGKGGQGWFTSLFNFKPASYTLYSSDPVVVTRRECARLLESFGVSVALEEDGGGHGVLKCVAEKIHDLQGNYHNKQVRFRVQFQSQGASGGVPSPGKPTLSAPPTPYLHSPMHSPMLSPSSAASASTGGCVITLVQERGARSSLEAVAQRLRHEWNLDSLSSATPSPMVESVMQFTA